MRCERFEVVVVVACLFGDVGGVAEVEDWFGHEDAHHGEGSHGGIVPNRKYSNRGKKPV